MKYISSRRKKGKSRPFWRGVGSTMEIRPARRRVVVSISLPPRESGIKKDAQALMSDWQKIGGDIQTSMDKFEREHGVASNVE